MITIAATGLKPGDNNGIIGGFSIKRYKMSTSDLTAVTNVQDFFTIGTNIEDKVDQYLNLVKKIRKQIEVPEVNFTSNIGYRMANAESQFYYDSSSTENVKNILNNAVTFETGYSHMIEIVADGVPVKTGSDKLIVSVGSLSVSHKESAFTAVDSEYTIYFDQESKLITSFGTGSPKDKKVKISVSFSWYGEDALIKKFNNGAVLFAQPWDTGEYSGFGFEVYDNTITQKRTWGTQADVGYYRFHMGCVSNLVGPGIDCGQIYHAQPYDASKPRLEVDVVMDSTFYAAPEVYSRL